MSTCSDKELQEELENMIALLQEYNKPLDLCKRWIKSSCPIWGIVLDMFWWSGSTMMACQQTKRKARLMELQPKYVQVIIKRFYNLTNWDEPITCLNREVDIWLIVQ